MEELNFVLLWKEQYQKIDESLAINRQLLHELVTQKVATAMHAVKRFKKRGIFAAVIYLFILGAMLFVAIADYSSSANYFIVSIGAIFLLNIKALYDYIKHLTWVDAIDYGGSIIGIQEELARLQASIVQHVRWMVLQLPFWTTFYLSDKWFPFHASAEMVVVQITITLLSTVLAVQLFRNLTIANLDKKWVRVLLQGSGGRSVLQALQFCKTVQQYRV